MTTRKEIVSKLFRNSSRIVYSSIVKYSCDVYVFHPCKEHNDGNFYAEKIQGAFCLQNNHYEEDSNHSFPTAQKPGANSERMFQYTISRAGRKIYVATISPSSINFKANFVHYF
ncbi:MAG: hypothetical protein ACK4SO_01165 [Candidatus Kapaibacteriota bacterium]